MTRPASDIEIDTSALAAMRTQGDTHATWCIENSSVNRRRGRRPEIFGHAGHRNHRSEHVHESGSMPNPDLGSRERTADRVSHGQKPLLRSTSRITVAKFNLAYSYGVFGRHNCMITTNVPTSGDARIECRTAKEPELEGASIR
jgi:hypothetical protein